MVEKRDCSFCGNPVEPGTGLLYIKRDGTRHTFCKAKCRRNLLDLKRVPRTVKWTRSYIKGLGKAAAVQTKAPAAAKQVAAAATQAGGATATEAEAAPAPPAKEGAKPARKSGEGAKGGKKGKA